jgi:hypothetical protein
MGDLTFGIFEKRSSPVGSEQAYDLLKFKRGFSRVVVLVVPALDDCASYYNVMFSKTN